MLMKTRSTAAVAGALAGLGILVATALPTFAQQTPTPATPAPQTHAQMDQMMDAMGGAGTAQRMHEAMGNGNAQQGDQLMQQCVQMMTMMQQMQGMMGAGGMDGQSMDGMMGGAGQ